jgi:aryl-alcohol dehydrogenase-like predicted oxidoreductase
MYPMPNHEEWYGESERIIGRWLKTVDRSTVVISTKMAGRCDFMPYVRNGQPGTRVTRAQIREAVEKSLKRLDTDYIDLFQFEWPDRYVQLHGDKFFDVDEAKHDMISFQEQVDAIKELIEEGKIRQFGLSNETPFGLLKFRESFGGQDSSPNVVSVQNAYNLLERNEFETSMNEACHYTNTSFIAHSPLAGGALTTKYNEKEEWEAGEIDEPPEFGDADFFRLNMYPGFTIRYKRPQALKAVKAYREISKEYGLTAHQLALSWCYSRPFIASTLVAATSVNQLRDNLMAMNCPLTMKMEGEIFEKYVNQHRDPTAGYTILGDELSVDTSMTDDVEDLDEGTLF